MVSGLDYQSTLQLVSHSPIYIDDGRAVLQGLTHWKQLWFNVLAKDALMCGARDQTYVPVISSLYQPICSVPKFIFF